MNPLYLLKGNCALNSFRGTPSRQPSKKLAPCSNFQNSSIEVKVSLGGWYDAVDIYLGKDLTSLLIGGKGSKGLKGMTRIMSLLHPFGKPSPNIRH